MGDAIRTTCPYCGVGCGVLARRQTDGSVTVTGDPDHPANYGRLCSKGAALGETLALDDRLLHPMIDGTRVSWDEALDRVATTFSRTIAEHGPDSVAFYGSGQLLTEDYYAANKWMKGYIGSANIDTNSRLCMASSVAGHKRAFGSDTVPGCYEDLELADLVVLVGSNLAWCHPVLHQRLVAAKQVRKTRIVVVDPRRTATSEIADIHLAIAPDSDVALFNGLLQTIVGANARDAAFIREHTTGFKQAMAAALAMPIREIARATGLSQVALFEFYELFVRTERVVTVYSQGVNQSTVGTDKVNAIINCHLATGRIGRPGMGPFSVTGQPNAMGGREVGGLSNMLAAHMELSDPGHRRLVQSFWKSPRMAEKPGLKAVDLFRAVADGRVKAIWIMATNPVDSLPEADLVRDALARCPFVVCSDVSRHTDTTALADVLLPAAAWGEKTGTVTNSERRISRQRAFLEMPGEVRPDWWHVAEVARRMGFGAAFAWTKPHDIFREHARLSSVGNNGSRDFDIGALATLDEAAYSDLAPVQWPVPFGAVSRRRMFGDGRFFTPDQRARFVPTPGRATRAPEPQDPTLHLNTGRIRDQWHTMTRTAKAPRLMRHMGEPYVEIATADARRFGLAAADIARVWNAQGSALLRVLVTDRQAPGAVFVPMHWTGQFASRARVDVLVAGDVDPTSGQPGLKQSRVRIEPYPATFYAVAVVVHRPLPPDVAYWAMAPIDGGWLVEMADAHAPAHLQAFFAGLLGDIDASLAETVGYHDAAAGQSRFAAFVGEKLVAALFTGPAPVAVSRAWATGLIGARWNSADRLRVLAGRPGTAQRDRGPIVCACLEIGRNDIVEAARDGCRGVDAIGTATGAGTNCGSCRPEIMRIIDEAGSAKAV